MRSVSEYVITMEYVKIQNDVVVEIVHENKIAVLNDFCVKK